MTDERFKGESEPIATNPILRGVDLAVDRLVRSDCFTERTLKILDDLRAEVLGVDSAEQVRAHYASQPKGKAPADAPRSVTPEWIAEQRERGWPDMHPEDYCHRCGARNIDWAAPADIWKTATAAWAAETGREGICCPACFAELYTEATGEAPTWVLQPWRGSWDQHEAPEHDDALAREALAWLSRFDVTPKGQAPADVAAMVEGLAYLITAWRFHERGLRGAIGEPDVAVARPLAQFLVREGWSRASQPVPEEQVGAVR
ncbi:MULTISPECIES: hypothetical protein [unclassified Microbacterium]|uniref:hypothetical protein n=1 Tax=Microbacterium TaxID=33882 RepID=UPI003BA3A0E7